MYFFDEIVPVGTGLIMSLEDNLITKHAVRIMDDCGLSGSIVKNY